MEYLGFEEGDILGHKGTKTTHYIFSRDILSYLDIAAYNYDRKKETTQNAVEK